MAVTAAITLTSAAGDLLTDGVTISDTATLTKTGTANAVEHTTGLARKVVKSTAKGTASGQVELYTADDFASIAYLYVKNTAAYHATNNIVYIYYDNHAAENIMEIRGGQFAYMPLVTTNNMRAYTSTSGTVVEHMIVGTEA